MKTKEVTRSLGASVRSVDPETVLLAVVDGPSAGNRLTLTRGSAVLGGEPTCDLVIDDPTVSRRHAKASLTSKGVQLTDLGSRNGTRYLGARIDVAVIPIGASFKLGKSTIQVALPHQAELEGELDETHGLIGRSQAMKRVFAKLRKVASTDTSVLLEGETGTGKSMLAKVIHDLSSRGGKPFVTIDCPSISPNLWESALFGHVRGAFTGAVRDQQGLIASASGGTVLFDGVGELPLELQPTLLRLLESKRFTPIGGSESQAANVRVIAATSKNLEKAVAAGKFRRDLFFRLAGVAITLPPLRDRRDDIALLARHFARGLKGIDVRLEAATIAAFQCESWPGNVRELESAVARALTLGGSEKSAGKASFTEARDLALQHFEHDYLVSLLAENGGNVSAAARSAKLTRSYFYTLLERHRLVARSKKTP